MKKAILSWSGGKDAAMALHRIRKSGEMEVVTLLTTAAREYQRSSMHGIRLELIREQAKAAGLPLEVVCIETGCSNEHYERLMRSILEKHRESGINNVVFGDIFLEDIRQYRERNLEKIGMKGVFPLWDSDSRILFKEILDNGFQAVVTCVDTHSLPGSFCGRYLDTDFLRELPLNCDACGENGEFHTFVHSGPVFLRPIEFSLGKKVLRDHRFLFCDLNPASFH